MFGFNILVHETRNYMRNVALYMSFYFVYAHDTKVHEINIFINK